MYRPDGILDVYKRQTLCASRKFGHSEPAGAKPAGGHPNGIWDAVCDRFFNFEMCIRDRADAARDGESGVQR